MFLKSVKARGFKSFGPPMEFSLEPGITVVVGPNGSGKSNIADAVVWAMGEQSPSALRGDSMQDIIFNGSDKLSPAGMAEVEVLFDNSRGQIPIEFSEVTVSRRVYRDGESSYFINRSACRLVDVTELLSDAGLGRDSHSIISQGKVDSILESKPAQRRAHIEEAAGLGKFKKRRRRAELKLEAVRRNLERLSDIEEEVKANLKPLKRQATAAERSAKLDLQIAQAQAQLFMGRLEEIKAELTEAEIAARQAGQHRTEIEQELTRTAGERRNTEELLTGSLQSHKKLADRFYSLKSQRDSLQRSKETTVERRRLILQGIRRAESRLNNLEGQIERVAADLKDAEAERSECESRLNRMESELEVKREELLQADNELKHSRKASREKTRRVGELAALKDRYLHQIEYLSQRKEKLAASIDESAREVNTGRNELAGLGEAVHSQQEKLAVCLEKRASAQSGLSKLTGELAGLESMRRDLVSDLRKVAEDLQIAKSRLIFISDSESGRNGLPPAAKEISLNHDVKALVELIEVEAGYEKALSAALGGMLFALAVDDIDTADGLLREAMDARLGSIEFLLPKANTPVERVQGDDYLIDHVSVPEGGDAFIGSLLSQVRVVDEINGFAGADGEGIWVTRDGIVYNAGKRLLSYKADPASSVMLRQRNERRQLEGEREAAETRHGEVKTEIASLDEKLSQLKDSRDESEQRMRRLAQTVGEIESNLAAAERRRRVVSHEAQIREASRLDMEAERAKLDEELNQARQKLNETEKTLAEAGGLPGTELDDEELAVRRRTISEQATGLKISLARLRERERGAALAVERHSTALGRLRRELAGTAFEISAYRRLAPVSDRLLSGLERLGVTFTKVLKGIEENLRRGEDESDHHSASLRSLSQAEADLQQKLSRASDAATEREVGLSRLRDQAQEQAQQLQTLKERFPDAPLDEEKPAPAEEIPLIEDKVERLNRRLELIGPVNPLAGQEYEEMIERQEFLMEQRADLESSLRELKGLIKELTGRIETSFAETFEAVRENFTEVIATLFPGGEGRLTLVEPPEPAADGSGLDREGELEDAAEAEDADEERCGFFGDRRGIEISVKPARKAVRSLSLLSGGERSLVAIAFLFAIFLARPAPFYILDEVEAALDDLNIDRLLNMLRQYQSRTQFIVITHQKRTMEVADVLYGLSMGADGTSKVLSRRMPRDDNGSGSQDAKTINNMDSLESAAVAS